MSRMSRRRRLAGVLAAITALALPVGLAAILAASGGSDPMSVYTATARRTAAVPAMAAGVASSRPVPAVPSQARPADPAQMPSAPATTTPAAGARTPAKVVEKPPPVVNGVPRINVGSAHSPQLQQQLSVSIVTTPPPSDAGALGVDVADYQHPNGAAIDWPQVAGAGYKFAFIKATEGDYYANPYYGADLAQAKAAGLYATGYHFAVPNVSGGASQADYAVRNGDYAADGRTLPLALDIEYNPYGAECYGLSAPQMVSWLSAFTAEVQRLTAQRPIIYTTADWWNTCTGGSTAFGSDPLWVAAYGFGSPPMPPGWGNWTFWQYTSRGSVPGITGNVDVSYFLRAAMRLLDPGNQRDAAGTAIRLQVTSLNATAGQSPHFTASGLPPGLSINGSGLISGTISPTALGTYGVTVTAASSSSGSGSVSFTWTVTPSQPSPPPSSTPPPSPTPSASPTPSSSPSSSPTPSSSPSPSPPSASPTPSPSPPSTPTPASTPAPASATPSVPSSAPSPAPVLSATPSSSQSAPPASSPSPSL